MLQKTFATIFLLAFFIKGFSQDLTASTKLPVTPASEVSEPAEKTPAFTFTGSADVYYRYDFGKTRANNFTSFTNSHNSFELGMASVKLEYKNSKVGMVADLGVGKRAQEFSYNDQGIVQAIKQLYVTYAPADWIKFTAGSWATHFSYEVPDPNVNRNYSMSYIFTNGPFFHTGLKADVTKGKHGFMVGVTNPTDYKSIPDGQINRKFLIAQYSLAITEDVKLYLNYCSGKSPDTSKSKSFNLVISSKVNDKFSLGYDGTISSIQKWDGVKNMDGKSWWGSAVYINVDPQSYFGLTLRGEYFSDVHQLKVFGLHPEGGKIFAATLSANFKINSLVIIPEFRIDNSNKKIFIDKNSLAKSSAASLLVAAVYSF